jgi:hypothetical protein
VALAALAAAERDGGRVPTLPPLRAEHDALAKTEPDGSLVVQETDRLVNAVDSLAELVARRP